MSNQKPDLKRGLALAFALLLFAGFIKSSPQKQAERLLEFLAQDPYGEEALSAGEIEEEFAGGFAFKNSLIDLNGALARCLGMKGLYADMGMYVLDDGYIVTAAKKTSADEEVRQTLSLLDFLKERDIPLLYVNQPVKVLDDSLFKEAFGSLSYSNDNADRFLARIREAGVPVLDLRENILKEGRDIQSLFYKTDHHWTVPAGLWASGLIARALNEQCGQMLNVSALAPENFEFVTYEKCWLGEQGRKLAKTYTGLDDFTEIRPKKETDYDFKNGDGTLTRGTFDLFVDEGIFNTKNNVYENGSWHYAYSLISCINRQAEKGKILLLGDSYAHVTEPFLSLALHEIDVLVLREEDEDFSLRDYIDRNGYDAVVIAYSQLMLGQDHPNPANRNMFHFD